MEEVVRPVGDTGSGINRDGKEVELEPGGMLARVIQHEVDHLNGILFVDHLEDYMRNELRPELKKDQEAEQEAMKIGFFGTPELAARVLAGLAGDARGPFAVTAEDKRAGRNRELQFCQAKSAAPWSSASRCSSLRIKLKGPGVPGRAALV